MSLIIPQTNVKSYIFRKLSFSDIYFFFFFFIFRACVIFIVSIKKEIVLALGKHNSHRDKRTDLGILKSLVPYVGLFRVT